MTSSSRAVRAILVALALAAAAAAPRVAHAQSEADRTMARDLARQGEAALDAKQYEQAIALYLRAHALVPAPTLLLKQAHAEIGLGRLVAAQGTLSRIVREGAAPGSPPAYGAAVDAATKELAELTPRVPGVVLEVTGATDATVTVDDERVPPAALGARRPVDPGRHVARARAEGFAPAEVTFTIAERGTENVKLALARATASTSALAPSPNDHAAPSGGSTLRTLGFVAIGVGGASLVAGAITGGLAIGKHGDATTSCNARAPSCSDDRSSYLTVAGVSTATFIAGGVLAAGGVLLVVVAPKRPSSTSVAAALGPSYVGLQGRF